MNLTTKILISQYEKLTEQELSQLFLADPYTWVIYNLKGQEQRLFDLLLWADNNLQFSRFSQTQLAFKLGTTREHINRMLSRLKQLGLVSFKQLGFNLPCIYKLNSYFRTINARDCLQHLFPSIKKIVFKFINSFLTNSKKSHYVLALNKNLIHNVPKRNVIHKRYNSNVNERGLTMTFEEKRRVLERMKNGEIELSPITPSVDGFKSLTLTTAGMVDLTAYTDEVVAYADHVLSKKYGYNNLDNPFGYVIRICKNRSAELGLPVQIPFAHKLREFYGIELSAPKHQPIQRTSTSSNSFQPIQRQKSYDHQGDKQTGMTHVETETSDQLKATITQELLKNENLSYSSNPYQLVGANGHEILSRRKRLATLEGERPCSLPTTPCQEYAYELFLAQHLPRASSPYGEFAALVLERTLANAKRICQNYCGNAESVAPVAPPSWHGTKIDDSEMNLEEVYELPTY